MLKVKEREYQIIRENPAKLIDKSKVLYLQIKQKVQIGYIAYFLWILFHKEDNRHIIKDHAKE